MSIGLNFVKFASIALLITTCSLSTLAADVGGVKVDDTAVVGGRTLKLNGSGMRANGAVNLFALGLYLTDKKFSPADVQSVTGPKRLSLNFQRDFKADDLGQLFVTAMNKNSSKEEKAKIINQTMKFGEMFASMADLKKGDVMAVDWIPGNGSVTSINGKTIGETIENVTFYNGLLRIWVGEQPADPALKAMILGGK